ncbi:MAG: YvcK family protein, partial [Acidobacteria bacterium]|nr:YvcK family protein [Acidobacteriota bacterium]
MPRASCSPRSSPPCMTCRPACSGEPEMLPMSSISTPPAHRDSSPLSANLRVAALGGGTGLPNVLRGLCALLYAGSSRGHDTQPSDRLVAIVTTTDDGGSSGRLRREFGVTPPGDIRNCLAALAEDQSLITALFQFRFEAGDGLNGHALGNLMLTALTEVTGDFVKAVEIAARVVGARGRVIPATVDQVSLSADLMDGRTISGET